ncbi:amidohydrolase family protein [Demetria terragena]|uniref:amidohydrolase family protein n=1 Tax=Demetria terragena TaxID=63959 RepID=UPI00039ADBB8|nr:amidohydrolase family protein [Demetria terragena]
MSEVIHLRGHLLIGPEEEANEAWVANGQLTFERPPVSHDVRTIEGYVLPGLVDAHCHIGLDPDGISAERAESHAVTEREVGALLLRDAGSPVDTSWMHEREDLPRLIRAGRHIARTRRYIRDLAHEVEPEDLASVVRQEARRGDGWVKLVGDWIDRETGDLGVSWPAETLPGAIAAAHEEGARVTAHCFGEQSLRDLAAAGIDCIEHATGLQEDSIQTFVDQGIAIVPTLVNIANFPTFADAGQEKFPTYSAHMRRLHESRYAVVGAAHDAGVAIYCGTDAGGQVPHGHVAEEVMELAKAGLTPIEAIGAATWRARAWLGCPGLEEGQSADCVVYQQDPRLDLTELKRPIAVILRGRQVG